MRSAKLLAAFVALAAAVPAGALSPGGQPSPAALAAARELVALVSPPEQRQATNQALIDGLVGNMLRGMVDADPEMKRVLERPDVGAVFARFVERQRNLVLEDLRRTERSLVEATARAYARRLDLQELQAARSFFATAAGRKFALTSSSFMNDPDIASWQRDLAASGQRRQDTELRRLLNELAPFLQAPEDTTDGS